MTTAQKVRFLLFGSLVTIGLTACADKPELVTPENLVSPYDSSQGDALWAVAPLRNESGTTTADVLAMTDAIMAKVQETRGISAVSTNRVLAAMRTLGMPAVRTPAEAALLARTLGVDGIVVGTITAYDPYDPPTVGLTLGLYAAAAKTPETTIDPRTLSTRATDGRTERFGQRPSAVVSEHFDARNHEVLMDLRRYATGRTEKDTALDWRTYLANSQLFAQFAANQAVSRLLDAERLRLAQSATRQITLGK